MKLAVRHRVVWALRKLAPIARARCAMLGEHHVLPAIWDSEFARSVPPSLAHFGHVQLQHAGINKCTVPGKVLM
eukprot:7014399-Prymnesium_polylepis.2